MKVYIYRMSSDTGLAPCVTENDNLLTLACCKGGKIYKGKACKTGIRYWIGSEQLYNDEEVFIIGMYKGKLLYWAKVTEALKMKEYYQNEKYFNRYDNIYKIENNELKRNSKYPQVHNDETQQKRDIAGEYVMISNEFVYLGNKAIEIDSLNEYGPKRQETKTYTGDIAKKIVEECKSKAKKSNFISNNKFVL